MINFFQASIIRLLNVIVLSVITIGLLVFSVIISLHNYQQTTTDLNAKASGISKLAAISLREPLWNFDKEGLAGIVTAIMLDKDVVGIEVTATESPEPLRSELTGDFRGRVFADVVARRQELAVLINRADIVKDGKVIGQVSIITSQAKALRQIKQTSILVAGFAAALILAMGFLVWVSARKYVAKPLKGLETSAVQLAHGDLDYPIDTGRHDEIGSLATSFSEMRDAIKKKIDDLHVLNTTGELLAGIHDQTVALETVLKVMKEQNNLESGSIYLMHNGELAISAFYPEKMDEVVGSKVAPKAFAVGEGVAGRVAQQRRTLFVPDTSKAPEFIANEAQVAPKALLCVPMMDEQEVFGVMNFSGEVGQVRFRPEDEEFALTLARLTVVTTKNIQMLKVIEEQNRTLEQKVLDRTARLRQKTNDINSMLQNMQQGIFTITQGGLVHPEYSAYLERILETTHIANNNFMHILFARAELGADQLSQIETAVEAVLGEETMMYEFNRHLLVSEFNLHLADGRRKILETDWAPILDDDERIEKIMVTVRDITELRGLQQEAESQRQELEIIGQILAVNRRKFSEFLSTSQNYLKENESLILATEQKDADVLATLFRNMHTIKGNARTYGFKFLTDAVHEAEHTYAELRHKQDAGWDQALLLNELHKAGGYVEKYKTVYETKLSKFSETAEGKFIDVALLTQIEATLKEADAAEGGRLKALLHRVGALLQAVDTEPARFIIDGIVSALPALAQELGKAAPAVHIEDRGVRINVDIAPVIRDVFMHTFRNAMDHGLEPAAERLAQGKPAQGNIYLDACLEAGNLVFRFHDDGRGLALARLRQKAQANGLLKDGEAPDDQRAAELIFHSGLSTAESVSDVSGRGVGMDAVRRFLQTQGGSIAVHFTTPDSQGCDYRPFALEIRLPGRFALQT